MAYRTKKQLLQELKQLAHERNELLAKADQALLLVQLQQSLLACLHPTEHYYGRAQRSWDYPLVEA